MPHPNEIISVPTILAALALLMCGAISFALLSLLPAWGWIFAVSGAGALVAALYFLQLEVRIYLLACQRYRD